MVLQLSTLLPHGARCSHEALSSCGLVQEQEDTGEHDAALEPILSSRETLVAVTKPLNGESSPAADDDLVREALAEAVLILVGTVADRLLHCGHSHST